MKFILGFFGGVVATLVTGYILGGRSQVKQQQSESQTLEDLASTEEGRADLEKIWYLHHSQHDTLNAINPSDCVLYQCPRFAELLLTKVNVEVPRVPHSYFIPNVTPHEVLEVDELFVEDEEDSFEKYR